MLKSNAKLKVKIEDQDETLTVHLGGDIDEDSEFQSLNANAPKTLIVDMDQVKFINSCGLRNWVNWLRALKKDTVVIFRNCPKTIVDQINILDGFGPTGGVVIESFYVPYLCETCNHEESTLVHRGQDYMEATSDTAEINKIPFSKDCTNCKGKMEIDVIPQKYFRFFKSAMTSR